MKFLVVLFITEQDIQTLYKSDRHTRISKLWLSSVNTRQNSHNITSFLIPNTTVKLA